MTRTRIKICGLMTSADVAAAVEAGADAVGFVFVKSSPRYLEAEDAANLIAELPPLVEPIGVFADARIRDLHEIAEETGLRMVQLHGAESEEYVEEIASDFAVVRGIRFSPKEVKRWGNDPNVDLLLVDGSQGGQGETFDWNALAPLAADIMAPVIVAGGLDSENVAGAVCATRPYGVDVSSGVESEPGVKDHARIASFCRAVREADRAG